MLFYFIRLFLKFDIIIIHLMILLTFLNTIMIEPETIIIFLLIRFLKRIFIGLIVHDLIDLWRFCSSYSKHSLIIFWRAVLWATFFFVLLIYILICFLFILKNFHWPFWACNVLILLLYIFLLSVILWWRLSLSHSLINQELIVLSKVLFGKILNCSIWVILVSIWIFFLKLFFHTFSYCHHFFIRDFFFNILCFYNGFLFFRLSKSGTSSCLSFCSWRFFSLWFFCSRLTTTCFLYCNFFRRFLFFFYLFNFTRGSLFTTSCFSASIFLINFLLNPYYLFRYFFYLIYLLNYRLFLWFCSSFFAFSSRCRFFAAFSPNFWFWFTYLIFNFFFLIYLFRFFFISFLL